MALSVLVNGGAGIVVSDYTEGPTGLYSIPAYLVESSAGSGLYIVPAGMSESSTGLYTIPSTSNRITYFLGGSENIKTYSVQEDATPTDPNSSAGGVGQITFGVNEDTETLHLLQETITLSDGNNGKTQGVIRNLSNSNGDVSITADSILSLFNSDHTVLPFIGTLAGAFQAYCNVVGITNQLSVDAAISGRSVVYPGWTGNVWTRIKQICAKESIELSLVFNKVVVRPLRKYVANTERDTSRSYSASSQGTAKTVEVTYYNNKSVTQGEIYPLVGDEPTIYQVDTNETVVVTQQLNASMLSVNQPVCTAFVNNTTYAGTNGVYSVTGNDGLPITPSQWAAQGGSLSVRITEDPSIIEITIVGSSMADYAPYRISMSAGTSSQYNSLHITGTGVTWEPKTVTLVTGATSAVTGENVGATVTNPFVSTLQDAHNAGLQTARAYAGSFTVSGNAFGINRSDYDQSQIRATIADFNTAVAAGTDVSVFNTTWVGNTVAQFNTYWQSTVDNLFSNQAFGNAAGSRVQRDLAWFRVTNATISETGVQFDAELNTLVSDFNTVWGPTDISVFNAAWANKKMKDFTTTPLRKA